MLRRCPLAVLTTLAVFTCSAVALDTITVTAPNGGEVLTAGQPVTITWTEDVTSSGYVDISLLRNGGYTIPIGSASVHDLQYTWTICDELADDSTYTVQIAANYISVPIADESDAPFTITGGTPPPILEVTYPNGGETLTAGTTQNIYWNTTTTNGTVDAWLITDGVQDVFLGNAPTGAGHLEWEISPHLEAAATYAIRLNWMRSCGPQVEDLSDATFSLTGSTPLPAITVTSPNGGEVWPADSTQTVTWNATDPTGAVEVWLTDDDTRYEFLGSAPTDAGQLNWPILPCQGNWPEARVLVRYADRARAADDLSDALFATTNGFTPSLTVTHPAAGATVSAGTTETVTWTSTNTNGMVDVELLSSGQHMLLIGRAPVSAGAISWEVCPNLLAGSDYAIRLNLPDCVVSTEGETFAINGGATASLTLDSPGPDAVWPIGSSQTIAWTATNLIGNVEILLPDTFDTYWGLVSVPVAAGSYTWTVPATLTPGDQYRIEIRHNTCGSAYNDAQYVEIVAATPTPGDADADGDADLRDFALLQTCFDGGVRLLTPPCAQFDLEPDADLDLRDYWLWESGMTGPGVAPPPDDAFDATDFALFAQCLAGPSAPPTPTWPAIPHDCRSRYDHDADGDLDLIDFSAFLKTYAQ